MQEAVTAVPETIFGYKENQVRAAILSRDRLRAFGAFFQRSRTAEVGSLGGAFPLREEAPLQAGCAGQESSCGSFF